MTSADLKRAKRDVRRSVLAARDAMPDEERERASARIAERVAGLPEMERVTTVMAFWSFGSELDTTPLIDVLRARGVRVALPRIVDGELEARSYEPGDAVTETTFGAREPAAGERVDPAGIDVVVTPAVAFDRAGRRVGYGGGFYDRFFPRTRADTCRVGVGFDLQLLDRDLPSGHFDIGVDVVVTPSEVVRVPRSP